MLYIADNVNQNIRKLALDQPGNIGSVVISTKSNPTSIYVDDDSDGPTIYVTLNGDSSAEKWIYGSSSGVQVGDKCLDCKGISLDREKNVYLADFYYQRVKKWSPKENTTTIISCHDDEFQTTDQCLFFPNDLYISQIDNSLYVLDRNRQRIEKWSNDGKIRITVAGSSIREKGTDAASLYLPEGVFVDDETETVYIADTLNNRVQRWLVNAFEGETIVGGYGFGNSAHQFRLPKDLDFDEEGNLYVSDGSNNRIQKFDIIDNRPCPATSKQTTSLITKSSATTAITTTITIEKSSPSTTTHMLTTITSTIIVTKHSSSTTPLNNHAVCSYWNCSYAPPRINAIQLLIFWIFAILF